MNWLTFDWWQYLLAPKSKYFRWEEVIACRVKGHPSGTHEYDLGKGWKDRGMHCRDCGDLIG